MIDLKNHRHWIEIIPTVSLRDLMDKKYGKLSPDVEKTIKNLLEEKIGKTVLYLPITGQLPSISVNGTYEKIAPEELGIRQRLMMEVVGGVLGQGAKQIGGLASAIRGEQGAAFKGVRTKVAGAAEKVEEVVGGVGDFIQGFAGGLDSTKVWLNSAISGLSLTGTIAFENQYEYQYFEAVMLVLQRMTLPFKKKSSKAARKMKEIAQALTEGKGYLVNRLNIFQLGQPASECKCRIISGAPENSLNSVTPKINSIILADEDISEKDPLKKESVSLVWDRALLASMEIIRGSAEGKGINNRGEPLVMTYNMTVEAADLEAVLSGISRAYNQNRTLRKKPPISTVLVEPSNADVVRGSFKDAVKGTVVGAVSSRVDALKRMDKADILRALMYQAFNRRLTATALKMSLGKAIDLVDDYKSINEAKKQGLGRLVIGGV
jgi:hypothetical protein